MSNDIQMHDDLDAYIATFDEKEREELAQAEAALDLSLLLYEARSARGLTQTAAAEQSGVKQQAISRWENSHPNMKLDTLRRYLDALGYNLDLVIKDAETGEILNPEVLASSVSATDLAVPGATNEEQVAAQIELHAAYWTSAMTPYGAQAEAVTSNFGWPTAFNHPLPGQPDREKLGAEPVVIFGNVPNAPLSSARPWAFGTVSKRATVIGNYGGFLPYLNNVDPASQSWLQSPGLFSPGQFLYMREREQALQDNQILVGLVGGNETDILGSGMNGQGTKSAVPQTAKVA